MTYLKNKIIWGRTLGAIGMLFPIAGNFIPPSNERASCFVIGSILMLTTALVERHVFFTALQGLILVGASLYFIPFTPLLKTIIPLACSSLLLLFFVMTGELRDKLTLGGSIGMVALALGYSIANPYVYLFGGVILAIYSTISYLRGIVIALLWAILNSFFTIATIINIYYYHMG